ncbi:restriction endonuclease subunit S [Pseudenhygromyxa sp. WMMC2535]|uniref:restriction endonuclease subunit S n=1 Tax=Pseudenhygromyxa sp. WMMC2535 TaxID=2712867 RepID=UPI0015548A23|nr:restriction endonuclease subunit S [Pseudenhygromyxa sp. WMMC2535]NVB39476.1 restriction endonuclease subunit S [Pseudenhygromyxa sp. WMMC2535]
MSSSLPTGWVSASISSLCRADKPLCYGVVQPGPEVPGGIHLVRVCDIKDGKIDTSALRTIAPNIDDQYARSRLEGREVLISIVGSIGRVAVATKELAGANIARAVARVFPEHIALPEWTAFALSTPYVQHHLILESREVARKTLNLRELGATQVPVPPLNEQRRIVAKIEALQARSEAAKRALDAIPPLLEAFRQSVLAAAFRGDLTKTWREQHPDVEPASALLERIRAERKARFIAAAGDKAEAKARAKAQAAGKPWTEADAAEVVEAARAKAEAKYVEPEPVDEEGLPELPEGWCWASTAEIVHPDTIITYGVVKPGPEIDDGVPYVRGQDIVDGTVLVHQLRRMSPELAATKPKSELKEGDILLCIIRHLRVAIVPPGLDGANITQGAVRMRPSFAVQGDYLADYLSSPQAQEWMKSKHFGLAMPRINVADARQVPIALPPIDEQTRISVLTRQYLDRATRTMAAVEFKRERLPALDQSILAKAFRGELVPQDPNDEPASVLLERIRAERAAASPKKKSKPAKQRAPKPEPEPPAAKPPPRGQLELPTLPVPAPAPTPTRVDPSEEAPAVMAQLRVLLRGRGAVEREATLHALAEHLGYQRVSAPLRKRLDGHLLAAVRRGVLEGGTGDELRLATRRLEDYERDELVAALRSITRRRCVYARDELARALLAHLGFHRLTKGARAAIKSAFNAAVRRGVFERVDAQQLRRAS